MRATAFAPDERARRPGLQMLILDEADLMLAMPGYEEDLQALAPLVRRVLGAHSAQGEWLCNQGALSVLQSSAVAAYLCGA